MVARINRRSTDGSPVGSVVTAGMDLMDNMDLMD